MPKQKLAIRDIARRAGVSVATISRVLNNKPDVAPETRARIRELLEQEGFHLSRAAVSLSTGRTQLIAMVVGELSALSETVEIVRVVTEYLARRGYGAVLWLSDLDANQEARYVDLLSQGSVDGAILASVSDETPLLERLRRSGLPVVLVEPKDREPGLPTVRSHHARAGELAVGHLAELGHRRIAIITIGEEWAMGTAHLAGFRRGMDKAGLAVDPDLVITHRWWDEMGYAAGQRWGRHLLTLTNPPTAIVCCGDNVALGVADAARSLGLEIPRHLSVVGFDDIPAAASITPGLTTIRQRAQQLGQTAAELLFRLITGEGDLPGEVLIPTELEVRGSTAPVERNVSV